MNALILVQAVKQWRFSTQSEVKVIQILSDHSTNAITAAREPEPDRKRRIPMTKVVPIGGSCSRLVRFSSTMRGCSNIRRLVDPEVQSSYLLVPPPGFLCTPPGYPLPKHRAARRARLKDTGCLKLLGNFHRTHKPGDRTPNHNPRPNPSSGKTETEYAALVAQWHNERARMSVSRSKTPIIHTPQTLIHLDYEGK